ncbi:MAG: hypothetical protein WC554_06755 [Clostridia bacterium]|jgi:hypothetical protein
MRLETRRNSQDDIEIILDGKNFPVAIYEIAQIRVMLRMTMQEWPDIEELKYCLRDFIDRRGLIIDSDQSLSWFPYSGGVNVSDPISGTGKRYK